MPLSRRGVCGVGCVGFGGRPDAGGPDDFGGANVVGSPAGENSQSVIEEVAQKEHQGKTSHTMGSSPLDLVRMKRLSAQSLFSPPLPSGQMEKLFHPFLVEFLAKNL